MRDDESWNSWGKHVLQELHRLNDSMTKLSTEVHSFKLWSTKEITKLKMKAGFAGFIAGIIPGIVGFLIDRSK